MMKMDLFFSKISHLFLFFLVVCFIPIIFGVSRAYPDYNHKLRFTTEIQDQCFEDIHFVFGLRLKQAIDKKDYFYYAMNTIRYLKPEETAADLAKYGPPPEGTDYYLLYTSPLGHVFNRKYAYEYYKYIADKYVDIDDEFIPDTYCERFGDLGAACRNTLELLGFYKENTKNIINFTYFNVVFSDIAYYEYNHEPGTYPPTIGHALMYFEDLAKAIPINSEMKWPEEFCVEKYPEVID